MPKSKEELAKISKATQFKSGIKAVESGKKGGIRSGEVKRERKSMKEMLDYLLAKQLKNNKGEDITTLEAITTAMIGQAIKGNVKAFTAIRDTIGEKQPETVSFVGEGVNIEIIPTKVDKKQNMENQ